MAVSRLQCTEIPLYAPENGSLTPPRRGGVVIEPGGSPLRSEIQLQFNLRGLLQFNLRGLQLYRLSPEEAHAIGASLVEHALECGYDPDTDKTTGEAFGSAGGLKMAYSDIDDFLEGFPQAQGNEVRANDALEDAADLVAKHAPPLDPMLEDYPSRAGARCERRVAAYLYETGGYLSSYSRISEVGGGESFRGLQDVLEIVEAVMGPYYVNAQAPSGGTSNTGYIGSLPW